MHALITAGGTVESVDDVRKLELSTLHGNDFSEHIHVDLRNISKGRFGLALAEAFYFKGHSVTLIGRKGIETEFTEQLQRIRYVPFTDVCSLQTAIASEVKREKPDFLLMAAAVSDYSPVSVEGKLSSKADELIIRCKRNPKILDSLRELVGDDTSLIGFKLVSRLAKEEMVEIARAQNARANLDFTVANDLQNIHFTTGIHPVSLVGANGAVRDLSGHRGNVARELVRLLTDLRDG